MRAQVTFLSDYRCPAMGRKSPKRHGREVMQVLKIAGRILIPEDNFEEPQEIDSLE